MVEGFRALLREQIVEAWRAGNRTSHLDEAAAAAEAAKYADTAIARIEVAAASSAEPVDVSARAAAARAKLARDFDAMQAAAWGKEQMDKPTSY